MNRDRPLLFKNLLFNLHDLDQSCKEHYLQDDKRLTSLTIMITGLLIPPMVFLDYFYYHFSTSFFVSLLIEILFLLFSCAIILLLKPVTQVKTYEYLVFTWTGITSLFACGSALLQSERILENMLFSTIFFIANFLSLPNRLLFRVLPAAVIYTTVMAAFLTNQTRFAFTDKYMFGLIFVVLTAFGIFTIAANNHFRRTAFNLQKDERKKRLAFEAFATEKSRLSDLLQQELAERQHAEAEIRRLNTELEKHVMARTAELETSNRELESLSYNIAHDMRSPVRAMVGYAAMLQESKGGQLDEEGRADLAIIHASALRLGQLIDDFLAYLHLGRVLLRMQPIRMDDLVQHVKNEILSKNPQRQIRFSFGTLPDCQADLSLLEQVWMQLIGNAVKFSRVREVAEIEIGAEEKDGHICYFVRDNGIGFNMKYAEKIFCIFQHLNSLDDYSGTGSGLAIARRIIERHGGRIWVDAATDKGATFYFTLGKQS